MKNHYFYNTEALNKVFKMSRRCACPFCALVEASSECIKTMSPLERRRIYDVKTSTAFGILMTLGPRAEDWALEVADEVRCMGYKALLEKCVDSPVSFGEWCKKFRGFKPELSRRQKKYINAGEELRHAFRAGYESFHEGQRRYDAFDIVPDFIKGEELRIAYDEGFDSAQHDREEWNPLIDFSL